MAQTLEQQRAQNAWECAEEAQQALNKNYDKYVKAAKGFPALIMNSGLMQVMAYAHDKKNESEVIAIHLRKWLSARFPQLLAKADFGNVMQDLMKAAPQDYQAINAEAFAWLKWLRQLAAARKGEE